MFQQGRIAQSANKPQDLLSGIIRGQTEQRSLEHCMWTLLGPWGEGIQVSAHHGTQNTGRKR
eukprot:6420223-Prorocentrum_lima.AAC.1